MMADTEKYLIDCAVEAVDTEKDLIDRAVEAVFSSGLLPCERGLDLNYDIAVICCPCYPESTIDVRKLVTLVLRQALDRASPRVLPAELFGPLELLEATIKELEQRSGNPDDWRDRLVEARLEIEGALADLRALQAEASSHTSDFALRLGAAQARLAAWKKGAPDASAK